MSNININSNKPSVLKAVLIASLVALSASFSFALPSTGAANMQTTSGVTFQVNGNTLSFTAPDRSVINWNNFGSGTDTIAAGDTVSYRLPSASSSILNVVSGGQNTVINGAIESNAHVYILNPNGIVIGNGARIDTAQLTLSAVDSAFAGQFSYINNGKLPSETGSRTAAGSITIGNAVSTGNIVALTKDISITGLVSSGSFTVNADGNVSIAPSAGTFYNNGVVAINNPAGNTTIGSNGATIITPNGFAVRSNSGSISTVAGSNINSNAFSLESVTGDIDAIGLTVPVASLNGRNITASFVSVPNPSVSVSGNGTISVLSAAPLTVSSFKNSGGSSSVTSAGKLAIGSVNVSSSANTSFTGASVTDSLDGVFIYGPASFTATSGDVSITKANHSFGPLSVAATGNATVFESAAMNLNAVRATNLNLKTNEFFFQTPNTASLVATKVNLIASGNAMFYTGNIANGLSINTLGNIDLMRLSLATNLNSVAPVLTTTGIVANPSP